MDRESPPPLVTEFAFTATVAIGEPLVVDSTPDGIRRYIPILGGTVTGPLLAGRVLAVGGDSQMIRPDGSIALEARYMIHTDDDVSIAVVNRGFRVAPPTVAARLLRGEPVAREDYYFRTAAQFEAPVASRYAYFNGSIFVSTAEREAATVIVHFYRVT